MNKSTKFKIEILFLLVVNLSLFVGAVNGQQLVSNKTETIQGGYFYYIKIQTNVDKVVVHVNFAVQTYKIDFYIMDEANYSNWSGQNGLSSKLVTKTSQSNMDDSFTLGAKGVYYLVWDNSGEANTKTVTINDVSLSASGSGGLSPVDLIFGGALVVLIGAGIYLRNNKTKSQNKTKNQNQQPPQSEQFDQKPQQ